MKPTYEDLVNLLERIGKSSKVQSVLDCEWVNYSVELFDELIETLIEAKRE
jgi:hypothetical protein